MNKRQLRVIKDIQERIPKDLLVRLMKKEIQAPVTKQLYEAALTKPDSEVSPKMKRRFRAVLDSGMLDREVEVLDHDVEKEISDFVAREIDIAVKLGRLPKEAPKLELLNNKGNQYARRQSERIRREYLGEDSDVVLRPEGDQEVAGEHPARPGDERVLHAPGAQDGEPGGAREDRSEGGTA